MTLTIGKAGFDVKPLTARPALDAIGDYLQKHQFSKVKVFSWDCRTQTGSDPDRRLTIELDCLLSFPVLEPGSITKVDKPKSVALRKAMQAHTGLKRKDMLAAIRKAVKPVSIDLDANDAVAHYGKRYSFDIMLTLVFRFFTLTPKNNAGLGSIVVGVPSHHLFYVRRTGMCQKTATMEGVLPKWTGEMHHASQHLEWFKQDLEHSGPADDRRLKRETERNAKKGIRIRPRGG